MLGIAAACGGGRPGPVSALDEYSRALEARHYRKAYDLMAERFRTAHSYEEFVRMVEQSPTEARASYARLRQPSRVEITAQVDYDLGDHLMLVYEPDHGWRIAANPIDFYSQATPRDTLRSFVRAYELKRWDVLLALAPREYRARMTEDKVRAQFEGPRSGKVDDMMQLIKANIDQPIEEKGSDARMPYGGHNEVRFLRESDGKWTIQDPG